jgi:O-succinylbenzoic acid--CoA ligase
MSLEEAVVFLSAWDEGANEFSVQSSGSTGEPKTIQLERKWMEWSALQTAKYMHPKENETIYCCLPLNKVGGLMVLVRSKVWGINLIVKEAQGNPLSEYIDADIISVTPYQMQNILSSEPSRIHLERFREVLIGGAEIPEGLELQLRSIDSKCQIRQSYGMSETYSHVAVRSINGLEKSKWFTPLENIEIRRDSDGSAVIFSPFNPEGLHTNDLIELDEFGRFQVLGRKDFVVNSGGVKLQIEAIEKAIHEKHPEISKFAISSVKDERLGEKLVLVCEKKAQIEQYDLSFLKEINIYSVPREIIEIKELPYNEGGKLDRIRIKALINN